MARFIRKFFSRKHKISVCDQLNELYHNRNLVGYRRSPDIPLYGKIRITKKPQPHPNVPYSIDNVLILINNTQALCLKNILSNDVINTINTNVIKNLVTFKTLNDMKHEGYFVVEHKKENCYNNNNGQDIDFLVTFHDYLSVLPTKVRTRTVCIKFENIILELEDKFISVIAVYSLPANKRISVTKSNTINIFKNNGTKELLLSCGKKSDTNKKLLFSDFLVSEQWEITVTNTFHFILN